MVSLDRFLANISLIKASAPTYRSGGTGADGTCDCVGLIMGAMYRAGQKKYDMHSSNYFARHQMQSLEPISTAADCTLGMVVYKHIDSTDDLHERYQAGGRYYTGDEADYYHVGVVTSVNPLAITHCTSGGGANGIIVDKQMGRWTRGGRLKGVDYDDYTGGDMSMAIQFAEVTSDNGLPVKLRSGKNSKSEGNVLVKLPVGTTVRIQESGAEWSRVEVSYLGDAYSGFMMSKFLAPSGGETGTVSVAEHEQVQPVSELEARVIELERMVAELTERIENAGI